MTKYILQDVESLDVTLERTPGLDNRVTLLPVDGEIIITDDDGMKRFLHESYVLHFNFHTVAVVGLEETFFNVSEDVVTVELCAIIYIPNGTVNCPIAHSLYLYQLVMSLQVRVFYDIIICSY